MFLMLHETIFDDVWCLDDTKMLQHMLQSLCYIVSQWWLPLAMAHNSVTKRLTAGRYTLQPRTFSYCTSGDS